MQLSEHRIVPEESQSARRIVGNQIFWRTRSDLRRVDGLVLSCVLNRNRSEVSETFVRNLPWVRVVLLAASHKIFFEKSKGNSLKKGHLTPETQS